MYKLNTTTKIYVLNSLLLVRRTTVLKAVYPAFYNKFVTPCDNGSIQ